VPSKHISFSEQYICESNLAVGGWERSLSSHIKILIAFYSIIICRKLLYKFSFRGHGSNPVSSLTSYIKEYLFEITRKEKKKKVCEVFNVLNTEQQQIEQVQIPFLWSFSHLLKSCLASIPA